MSGDLEMGSISTPMNEKTSNNFEPREKTITTGNILKLMSVQFIFQSYGCTQDSISGGSISFTPYIILWTT